MIEAIQALKTARLDPSAKGHLETVLEGYELTKKKLESLESNGLAGVDFNDPVVKKKIKVDEHNYSLNMSAFLLTFGLLFYPNTVVLYSFMFLYLGYLLLLRFIKYRRNGEHYFFFDYCYWVILGIVVVIMFFPDSPFYVKSTLFLMALGPLSTAFFVFLYRIVFHDMDSFTSLYMHLSPCLAVWIMRFHITDERITHGLQTRDQWEDWISSLSIGGKAMIFVYPTLAYFTWNFLYYILIFKILNNRILERNYTTLYSYTRDTSAILKRFFGDNESHNQRVYMVSHAVLAMVGMVVAYILFFTRYLTFLYVFVLIFKPIFTSATFFLKYFIKKYGKELSNTKKAAQGE